MYTSVTTSQMNAQPKIGKNIKYNIVTRSDEEIKKSVGNKVNYNYIIDGRYWSTDRS